MSEQTAQEPTMEEILASIRRIISEDDAPAAPAAAPAPAPAPVEAAPSLMDETPSMEEDDVLELTQRWDEPAPVPTPTPIESIGDIDIAPRPEPAPREEPRFETPRYEAPRYEAPTSYDPEPETLVSDRTADAAAGAFAGLAQSLLMPSAGRSLEDVVKELMKPMLRDWLDQNLPGIVEAQVRAEVERIARRGSR
jgi:cell pole-organizing protein PopZ